MIGGADPWRAFAGPEEIGGAAGNHRTLDPHIGTERALADRQ